MPYVVDEPWAKVPMSLVTSPGITLSDVELYVYLDYRAGRRGWWYGSQPVITTETALPLRTVQRSVAALSAAGYIAVERLGTDYATVNKYIILARTVSVEPERPAKNGASVSEFGGTDAPTLAGPTTTDLTDPEPQIEEGGLITDRRKWFKRATGRKS
jgi:hypothetical protein